VPKLTRNTILRFLTPYADRFVELGHPPLRTPSPARSVAVRRKTNNTMDGWMDTDIASGKTPHVALTALRMRNN